MSGKDSSSGIKTYHEPFTESTVYRQIRDALWEEVGRKVNCDVIVKTGGESFHCHKLVLCSVSPYFEAMFSSGMLESSQETVEIKGIAADDFRVILRYMYLGWASISPANVLEILDASSMLLTECLTKHVEEFLTFVLPKDDWWLLQWRVASKYSIPKLAKKIEVYLAENFTDLPHMTFFGDVTGDELACILSRSDLQADDEADVLKVVVDWILEQDSVPDGDITKVLSPVIFKNIPDNRNHLSLLGEERTVEILAKMKNRMLHSDQTHSRKSKDRFTWILIGSEVWANLLAIYIPEVDTLKYAPMMPRRSKSTLKACVFKGNILCADHDTVYKFKASTGEWKAHSRRPVPDDSKSQIIEILPSGESLYVFTLTGKTVSCLQYRGDAGWEEMGSYEASPTRCFSAITGKKIYLSGWDHKENKVVEFDLESRRVRALDQLSLRPQNDYCGISLAERGGKLFSLTPTGEFGCHSGNAEAKPYNLCKKKDYDIDHVMLSKGSDLMVLKNINPQVQSYTKVKSTTEIFSVDPEKPNLMPAGSIRLSLLCPKFGRVKRSVVDSIFKPKKVTAV